MTLVDDWKLILKRAWSVKFNIAATIFGATEVIVQLLQPAGVPGGLFAAFAVFSSIGANVSRLLAQKELTDAPNP